MLRLLAASFALALVACGGTGKDWVQQLPDPNSPVPDPGWNAGGPLEERPLPVMEEERDGGPPHSMDQRVGPPADESPERIVIGGGGRRSAPQDGRVLTDDLFRNTYYDFPSEGKGAKSATVFDASCSPIAAVTRDFHDAVCVQGSGRMTSGATISFAKRDCPCAALCPRTGQQICFERLDPARYPSGRGATGRPITPLRTVAVDSNVIPLGTAVFIPELRGLPRGDGSRHDGCFLAEDRGLRVQGRQVDVFTGDPKMTARWNALYPSNRGVHVRLDEPRCQALRGT